MAKKSFSITKAISYGFDQTKGNLKFFIVLLIIVGITYVAPGFVAGLFGQDEDSLIALIVSIVGWVIQAAVGLGIIGIALKMHDKKKAKYENLFEHFNILLPYIGATIVYGAIVLVGFILLVIPGIVWSVKYGYYTYFMVDRGMGPIDAIKASGKLTEGAKWNIFLFRIVLTVINIIGFMVFFVGLFITIPLTMMAEAYVYRKLSAK